MRTVIFGAGGFGREVATLLRTAHAGSAPLNLVFASDDGQSNESLSLAVITPDQIGPDDGVTIAVGDGSVRKTLLAKVRERGGVPVTVAAKTAVISSDAQVGDGAVFSDFTMVTAKCVIGQQFQCNIYSYVAHDCVIGDFVTFAPKVACNGNVTIGDMAYIGTGAVLKQGVTIGAGAVVGMGAVVTKDVPPGVTVVGNPAKPLERR